MPTYKKCKVSQESELPSEAQKSVSKSFFNATLQPQPLRAAASLYQDRELIDVLKALLKELKESNHIERSKRKREDTQKQCEAKTNEEAKIEDEKRFSELRPSLYS